MDTIEEASCMNSIQFFQWPRKNSAIKHRYIYKYADHAE